MFLDLFPLTDLDPAVTPGSTLHMMCQINSDICNRTATDLKFVFQFSNGTDIPINESYVRVINTTTIELNYPDIQLHHNMAYISCQDRIKWCKKAIEMVYVGCKWLSAFFFHVLDCCTYGLLSSSVYNSLHASFVYCALCMCMYCLGKWVLLFAFDFISCIFLFILECITKVIVLERIQQKMNMHNVEAESEI